MSISVSISVYQEEDGELAFLQDDNVSEDLDVHTTLFNVDQASKDLSHCFASSFDVHCADTQDDGWAF